MPTYVFKCPCLACGFEQTVVRSIEGRDDPLACPKSHGPYTSGGEVLMQRLPTAASFSVGGAYTAANGYGLKEGKR